MQISFERGTEVGRERRTLPADHYRLIRLLYSRQRQSTLFVPIRSMQYLGLIDQEEVAFVDGQGPRRIEISWCDFKPSERDNLLAPIGYSCVYYDEKGREIMSRLQTEFFKALEIIADRQPKPPPGGEVTPFDRT